MPTRFGILGTANIAGSQMVAAMRLAAGCEPRAVASRDSTKAAAFARQHGIAKSHGSYEALLADPEVDAVYLPLPTGLHLEWALKCAAAGKPLLCEKPLAVNAADARRILDAFTARKLPVMEGYMYRFHPLHEKVRELLTAGAIGELRAIHSTFHVNLPETDVRYSRELGGGALLDLGCYCVGIARFLAGSEPHAFSAQARFHKGGVDAGFAGTMEFPGSMLATFSCSLDTRFDCRYEVYGTGGRLFVERGAMVAWPGEAFIIRLWSGDKPVREVQVPAANHYQLMLEAFAAALQSGGPMPVAHAESLANLSSMDHLMSCARA